MRRGNGQRAKRSKRTEIAQRPEPGYGDLLTGISDLLDQARRMSARSVNGILTALHNLLVRRQKRKTLINDVVLAAELADVPVPPQARVAAVLYVRGDRAAVLANPLQRWPRETLLTPSRRVRPASRSRRVPSQQYFSVGIGPMVVRGGPVQHVTIDVVGSEIAIR